MGMMHCQGNHQHHRAITFHKIQHRLPYSLTVLPTTETCLPSLSLSISVVPFLKAFHQLAPNFVQFLMSKKKRKFRIQIKICLPKNCIELRKDKLLWPAIKNINYVTKLIYPTRGEINNRITHLTPCKHNPKCCQKLTYLQKEKTER